MTAPTLAPVINLFTRQPAPLIRTHLPAPRPVDIPAWWTCPAFCDSTCTGGEGTDFGNGVAYISARMHRGVIHTAKVGAHRDITVAVSVIEEPRLGYDGPATVDIEGDISLDPDGAAEFAYAVLRAAVLARQPLPLITRPPSHGGGRASTPREAS